MHGCFASWRPSHFLPRSSRPRLLVCGWRDRADAAARTTSESSWHRRARRNRQAARGVIALARARNVLAAHHGGGMGGGGRGGGGGHGKGGGGVTRDEDWKCPVLTCGYYNFAHRKRCRICEALPAGQAAARVANKSKGGKGKGGGGGARASEGGQLGGIALRQVRQAEAAAAQRDRELADQKRTVERLQRQLEAAKKANGAPEVFDIEDDADDDDADEAREANLAAEVKNLEDCLRALADSSPVRDTLSKRVEDAKSELQQLREARGGPEAKVLGLAGRHAKELRATRARLLKRRRAQERLEAELADLTKERKELDDRIGEKEKLLKEAREEAQKAHDELEKLSKANNEDGLGGGAGAVAGEEEDTQATRLVEKLSKLLPAEAQPHLQLLHAAALQQRALQLQQQQQQAQQQQQHQQLQQQQPLAETPAVGAAAATAAAAAPQPPAPALRPTTPLADGAADDMEDLDAGTVELLGVVEAMLDGAEQETTNTAADSAGRANRQRAVLVQQLKKRGTTAKGLQARIRDLRARRDPGEAIAAASATPANPAAAAAAAEQQTEHEQK